MESVVYLAMSHLFPVTEITALKFVDGQQLHEQNNETEEKTMTWGWWVLQHPLVVWDGTVAGTKMYLRINKGSSTNVCLDRKPSDSLQCGLNERGILNGCAERCSHSVDDQRSSMVDFVTRIR